VTDAGHPTRPTHPIAIVTGATGAIDSATARRLAAALLDHEAIAAAKGEIGGLVIAAAASCAARGIRVDVAP
jgi:NAD(P)-dependent dehydrogenase (short-subunit alcohol dehydrogenase family)